jgi:uncharacterized protein
LKDLRQPSPAGQKQAWQRPHEVNWIVKASKLCNLRCRYCYEWNELHLRDRIPVAQWRSLLGGVRDYHALLQESLGSVRSNIIWHGGEPLLLPPAYFQEVFAAQREILKPAGVKYVNFLQTNLYSLPQKTLQVLENEDVHLGVSFDLIRGVRMSVGGAETEKVVAGNIERLLDRGVRLGAVVVLSGHTSPRVREIYDFYATLGMSVRFLPLFDAPLNTPDADFALTTERAVVALKHLFDYWLRGPSRIPVWPLIDYVYTALLRRTGESRRPYDRQGVGEWALLVGTDGTLYHRPDAYKADLSLGNIFKQSIGDILASQAYSGSLERDARLVRRFCAPCRYRGACSTLPLFDTPRTQVGRRCGVTHSMYGYVERSLAGKGFTTARIQQLLSEL